MKRPRLPLLVGRARFSDGELRTTLVTGRGPRTVTVRGVEPHPGTEDDAFVPIAHMAATTTGRRVVCLGRPGRTAVASTTALADEIRYWFPGSQPVRIAARFRDDVTGAPGRGVGLFFSGGLDSFHALATNRGHVDELIFVWGFDVASGDVALRDAVATGVRGAASELGLPLHEVTTDLRSWSDGRFTWTGFANAGIAMVGLASSARYREVCYAATAARRDHPGTLPDGMAGVETTRPEKAAIVARDQVARAHLRVCWENRGGRYNCGRCEKCVRTMVNLAAVGALGEVETLPSELPPPDLERVLGTGAPRFRRFLRENLDAAEAAGERAVARRLERLLELSGD